MKAWRSVRRAVLLGTTSLLTAALAWPAAAEVSTDGSLGRKVTRGGRDVTVEAGLGRRRGGNLFHSFDRFGVPTGGSVTFTGPGGIDNVVSRVTGGERSDIDGTVRSRVPGADFYLINPAGIVFGPNASLDVSGSFHASTADELRFSDGAVFSALDPGGSQLSVAAPRSFGFLGERPNGITVDRGVLVVPPGEALSLVGGDVVVTAGNAGIPSGNRAGIVAAPGGRLTLTALSGPGAAGVATGETSGAAAGTVALIDQAAAFTGGDGGGSIQIRGGNAVIANSSLVLAANTGDADARGGVTIEAGAVTVVLGSTVSADAFGRGDAGSVRVSAEALELRAGSRIGSSAFAAGDAGTVEVRAGRLLADGAGGEAPTGITSDAAQGSTGDAGDVRVSADRLELRAGGRITSDTFAAGDAGSVRVIADALELRSSGRISSITFGGAGNAGTVEVRAGRLLADGAGGGFATGITSDAGPGSTGGAGDVQVAAEALELRNGGRISSSAFAAGDAGNVEVRAGRLLADRAGSEFFTGVTSNAVAGSTGDAGTVRVAAATIELRATGAIRSGTDGPGQAGSVQVAATDALTVDGGLLETNSTSSGRAGDVVVTAQHLRVEDGGLIGSSGSGTGAAGSVRIAAERLEVREAGIRTEGTGAEGGRIDVAARERIYLQDAEVTSSGIVPAAGASLITLEAPFIVLNDSRVTSLTGDGEPLTGSGEANLIGDVTVISADSVVAGSSAVEIAGLQQNLGSGLQVAPGAFLDTGRLLRASCAARGAARSSFTAGGRGGLPPAPDRPLGSLGAGAGADRAGASGTFDMACAAPTADGG